MLASKPEIDMITVKHRSISGAIAFVTRTFLLYGIGVIAFAFLSGLLTTEEIGVFIVVEAIVGILVYFSDVGLGAALIQKKSRLTRKDLTTTFTIQQVLVVCLVTIALLLGRKSDTINAYGPGAQGLFQALVFAFFLSSLKTVPSILLERKLDFNKLVIPQVVENFVYYSVLVYFAWKGLGVTSYTYAVISRGIVGLIVIYLLQPWSPGLSFDTKTAKSLVNFGAPFQLFSILALIKDKVLIIFLGRLLGVGAVGLLGWAEKWSQMPIRFFADPVLRVTFPAYSRLQDHSDELKKAIEKSIFFVSSLVFPSVLGMIAVSSVVIGIVPRYAQWQPALAALVFYGINSMFSSVSITLTNTLNATGKVKKSLMLMVMWTVLTWTTTPVLIYFFDFTGAAMASALTASSSLIAYYMVKRIVQIRLLPQVLPQLFASLVMFLSVVVVKSWLPSSLFSLSLLVFIGAITYGTILMLIARDRLLQEISIIRKYLRNYE